MPERGEKCANEESMEVAQPTNLNRDTGKQVWLTNDDCRQHFLVVGTTGAGKTEALLGFAANALT
jgi:type IV secretory pathway VirB4 component